MSAAQGLLLTIGSMSSSGEATVWAAVSTIGMVVMCVGIVIYMMVCK